MHTIKQTLPPSNSPNNFRNTSLLSLNISSQYNDNEYSKIGKTTDVILYGRIPSPLECTKNDFTCRSHHQLPFVGNPCPQPRNRNIYR